MKHTTQILFITLFSLLLATALHAQRFEREETKAFKTVGDPDISISSEYGVVRVKGHDKHTVKIKVTIQAKEDSDEDARKLAEEVDVKITGSGQRVSVVVDYPSSLNMSDDRALHTMVYMYAPHKAKLEVENRFGEVDVQDIRGSVAVGVKYGNMELRNVANLRAKSKYGNMSLASVTGSCEADMSMGNLRAHDVPGGKFHCSYGEVSITNSTGLLNIDAKMGNVSVRNVRSGKIDLSYGNVDVKLAKDFGGKIGAVTKFGSVDSDLDLHRAKKDGPGDMEEQMSGTVGSGSDKLIVKNRFGNIEITQD